MRALAFSYREDDPLTLRMPRMLVCSFNFPSRPELVPIRRAQCGGHGRVCRVPYSCFAPAVSAGVCGFSACGERNGSLRGNRRSGDCLRGTLCEIVSNPRRSRVWWSCRADGHTACDIRLFWEHARDSSRSTPGRCSPAERKAVSADPPSRARRAPGSRSHTLARRSLPCRITARPSATYKARSD